MVRDDGVSDGAARQAADTVKHFLMGEKVAGVARREDFV
jgi:hypothetical protein